MQGIEPRAVKLPFAAITPSAIQRPPWNLAPQIASQPPARTSGHAVHELVMGGALAGFVTRLMDETLNFLHLQTVTCARL